MLDFLGQFFAEILMRVFGKKSKEDVTKRDRQIAIIFCLVIVASGLVFLFVTE